MKNTLKLTKKERLKALVNHFSNGNSVLFAQKIGRNPTIIYNWINRGSYDIELLYSKCEGVNAHWLLTGEGEMLSSSSTITQHGDGSAASINGNASVTNGNSEHVADRIELLERLLEEKERTIQILMSQRPL